MKTILEWLKELDEPYRSNAIENAANDTNTFLPTNVKTCQEALLYSFIWKDSTEGFIYWDNLCTALDKK